MVDNLGALHVGGPASPQPARDCPLSGALRPPSLNYCLWWWVQSAFRSPPLSQCGGIKKWPPIQNNQVNNQFTWCVQPCGLRRVYFSSVKHASPAPRVVACTCRPASHVLLLRYACFAGPPRVVSPGLRCPVPFPVVLLTSVGGGVVLFTSLVSL